MCRFRSRRRSIRLLRSLSDRWGTQQHSRGQSIQPQQLRQRHSDSGKVSGETHTVTHNLRSTRSTRTRRLSSTGFTKHTLQPSVKTHMDWRECSADRDACTHTLSATPTHEPNSEENEHVKFVYTCRGGTCFPLTLLIEDLPCKRTMHACTVAHLPQRCASAWRRCEMRGLWAHQS